MPSGSTEEKYIAVKVHVLVMICCDRCDRLCERYSVADITPDGRIGYAKKPRGEVLCDFCHEEDQKKVSAEIKKARQQSRWRNQATKRATVKP